jgi:pSer/pThr/pTyr-binding forkhead associated (FHA) protein
MTTTQLCLLVRGGVHDGKLIPIQTPFLIGRAPECNLRPASLAVSGRHCLIEECRGNPVVRDLDSTNGTFLNDNRLMDPCELRDGAELRVGPLTFRVFDVSAHTTEEPEVPAMRPRDSEDTVVNRDVVGACDTVVNDDRLTDDEVAKLLLAEDESDVEPATSEAVMRVLDVIEEPAVVQPTAAAAKDILRQMRRSKK